MTVIVLVLEEVNFNAHAHTHAKRVRAHARRKELMKKYKIKIEDKLPFPDEKKNNQWIQILNNPTSIAALIIIIGELEDDKKLTIECYHE